MGRARPTRVRHRFRVSGLVQGVGFRPFAYVTAAALAPRRTVANTPDGVVIEVEGDPDAVREYGPPARARTPRRWPW
jgi:hydrogenase maturation protein HypF